MGRAMQRRSELNLSTFDGRLLDGLNFCRKVYALFEQTKAGADGIAKLRLRPTKIEKRLIEELIPLSRYVQARYREGRKMKVRWSSGSQPYDCKPACNSDQVGVRTDPWTDLDCIAEVRAVFHWATRA
jgi:hypothetical protein